MNNFFELVLFVTYYIDYQCYSTRQYEYEILSICLKSDKKLLNIKIMGLS